MTAIVLLRYHDGTVSTSVAGFLILTIVFWMLFIVWGIYNASKKAR